MEELEAVTFACRLFGMQVSLGFGLLAGAALAFFAVGQDGQDTAAAKRKRLKDNAADFWIYDDIAAGTTKAKAAGKPLLVSFRCVP